MPIVSWLQEVDGGLMYTITHMALRFAVQPDLSILRRNLHRLFVLDIQAVQQWPPLWTIVVKTVFTILPCARTTEETNWMLAKHTILYESTVRCGKVCFQVFYLFNVQIASISTMSSGRILLSFWHVLLDPVQSRTQQPWQEYANYPAPCWGDRRKNSRFSRSVHKVVTETVWLDNWKNLEWAKEAFERKMIKTIGGDSYQSCTRPSGGDKSRNRVNKRLPPLSEVKEVHAQMMESGDDLKITEQNTLMEIYVKLGSMVDARNLFENMPKHNVVSFNLMIMGYAKREEGIMALELYAQMHQEGIQPSDRTFVAVLKACSSLVALEEAKNINGKIVKLSCLEKGRAIHSKVIMSGFDSDVFVGTTLVDMYAKCGSMKEAHHVFDKLHHHDVVLWTSMILGYSQNQQESAHALQLYAQMQQEGVQPNNHTFVAALKACSSLAALEEGAQVDKKIGNFGCLEKGRAIHSQAVKSCSESDVFVGTILVDMYAKCGSMEDAWHVFDNLPHRDVVSWTSVIMGYVQEEEGELALELYSQMHQQGVQANNRTLVAALKACALLAALENGKRVDGKFLKTACLEKGRNIHSQAVKSDFDLDVYVGTTLVDMYMKCESMEDAWHVFVELPHHDVVSWTAMILGYAQRGEGAMALKLYSQMHKEGVVPYHRTFVGALKACSSMAEMEDGKQIDGKCVKIGSLEKGRAFHSQAVNNRFESDIFVVTTLVDMYAVCGSMEDARHAFDEMPHRNAVPWTAMILGHAQNGQGILALELYGRMLQEGVEPYHKTFVGTLKACSSLALVEYGKQLDGKFVKIGSLEIGRAIHSQAIKSGFESDVFVGTTLVDMYAKCGSLEDARHIFLEMPYRNVVSWTALILGYAEQDEGEAALQLHAQMQGQGLSADNVAFISILKACGNAAALKSGKELHAQICSMGLETTAMIANTLMDMYAKCGSMVDAQRLFDALPIRDCVTWSTLIAGYARQGESESVFYMFDKMEEEGIKPNGFTFLSVLSVCSHAGLLDMGEKHFYAMRKQYGIIPSIEHYNCMIDLLGRAGHVEAALAMVEKMPFQPNIVSWVSVLGACQKWKNAEVGRLAFERVVRLDEKNAAVYELMSNICVHDYRQEDEIRST